MKNKEIEKLKLTKEEYNLYSKEISDLEDKLGKYTKKLGDMRGNDFTESGEVTQLNNEIIMLKNTIKGKKIMLNNAIIIEKTFGDDQMDINDIAKITLKRENVNPREILVKLSGSEFNVEDGIIGISLNSPIGKAIHGKKVGDEYTAITGESQIINGEILEIRKNKVKANNDSVQKKLQ